MPYRQTQFTAEACYHIYNRGVAKQPIFFEEGHYRFFLLRVREYIEPVANVLAYCLMPNHYHLILQLKTAALSGAMCSHGSSYAQAINRWRDRTGPLYDSRFQSIQIDSDPYLIYLSRYIHRNPVEAGLVEEPERWEHSSFRDFTCEKEPHIAKPELILRHFECKQDYERFVKAPVDRVPVDLQKSKFRDPEARDFTEHGREASGRLPGRGL